MTARFNKDLYLGSYSYIVYFKLENLDNRNDSNEEHAKFEQVRTKIKLFLDQFVYHRDEDDNNTVSIDVPYKFYASFLSAWYSWTAANNLNDYVTISFIDPYDY